MKKRNPKDINEVAFKITQKVTNSKEFEKSQISQIMSHMGRLGGLKGGKARANSLTPERRSEIAKKAAQKRWDKKS
jgi:hypothetical protein